ncbi:MAG TPA: DUF6134 family protein [Magnetospirillum sp.]|nr:DUF6134 family protein [Magnetospirillum sp.]
MWPIRIVAMAVCVACASASAHALEAPREPLNFTVLRNGEPVGTHTLRFQRQSDGLSVAVDTNVVVKMALIPVYRFEHHGQETWQQDRLAALNSTTNDDGTHHTLKVAAGTAELRVDGDGVDTRLPPATLPASLWNRETVAQGTLMNTLDGRAMSVQVTDLGDETVTVHGQPRHARHYSMAGDLARELWYDPSGTLVQLRFKGKDGSDILYVLN